jgi:MoaA/NifB/PqqE/SkfB family radical SAM enzyme
MNLKLKEIIWEITGQCKNGCSYCGSKEVWNEPIDIRKIKAICDKIAEYPPEEIDISGGDPTLVPIEMHKYIVTTLKNTKCKILLNLKSLDQRDNPQEVFDILSLYSHIGISINTREDVEIYKKYNVSSFKHTIITNFNIANMFLFNSIASAIGNTIWQIQFTVYNDSDNELALYNNPEALIQMQSYLDKCSNQNIVIADNANNGECTAGLNTLGILSDGSVVPCLSMRSWCNKIGHEVEGSLYPNTSLKHLWMNGFQEQRFGTVRSCKDHCKKQILWKNRFGNIVTAVYAAYANPIGEGVPYVDPRSYQVTVYAVTTQPPTMAYAVTTIRTTDADYDVTIGDLNLIWSDKTKI